MTTIIKIIKVTDVPYATAAKAIADINTSVGKSYSGGSWTGYTSMLQSSIKKTNVVFDLAQDPTSGKYIGYSQVVGDCEDPYLIFLAVDKSCHKQGIGSTLLEATVKKVKQVFAKNLSLHCYEPNLGFYTKFADKHKDEMICSSEMDSPRHASVPPHYSVTFHFKEPLEGKEKPAVKKEASTEEDRQSSALTSQIASLTVIPSSTAMTTTATTLFSTSTVTTTTTTSKD